jgi:hypothetical protein
MAEQEQERWIACRVYPGMFSDERAVEVGDQSFFVNQDDVRDGADNAGQVKVTIIEIDGREFAVIPTSTRETVALPA